MKTTVVVLALVSYVLAAQAQQKKQAAPTVSEHRVQSRPVVTGVAGAPAGPPWHSDSIWVQCERDRESIQAAMKKNRTMKSDAVLANSLGRTPAGGTNSVATLDQGFANMSKSLAQVRAKVQALTEKYIRDAIEQNQPPAAIDKLRGQQKADLDKYAAPAR